MLCAADSSCFFTVTGLWYWVANWYKYCVLQTAFASLHSPECDTEWVIGINVVCCRQQFFFALTGKWYWVANYYKFCVLQTAVASFHSAECDTLWLSGVNVTNAGVWFWIFFLKIYFRLPVLIYSVHKNVNHYVSLYLNLVINTEIWTH